MYLWDREDKMQDAILDILEKGYQEAPNALVIRIMKNKIIDIMRSDKRRHMVLMEVETAYYDEIEVFELFKNINYRNYLIAKGVAFGSAKDVAKSISMPYKTVIAKYRAIKRELKKDDKDSIRITRGNSSQHLGAL